MDFFSHHNFSTPACLVCIVRIARIVSPPHSSLLDGCHLSQFILVSSLSSKLHPSILVFKAWASHEFHITTCIVYSLHSHSVILAFSYSYSLSSNLIQFSDSVMMEQFAWMIEWFWKDKEPPTFLLFASCILRYSYLLPRLLLTLTYFFSLNQGDVLHQRDVHL